MRRFRNRSIGGFKFGGMVQYLHTYGICMLEKNWQLNGIPPNRQIFRLYDIY